MIYTQEIQNMKSAMVTESYKMIDIDVFKRSSIVISMY